MFYAALDVSLRSVAICIIDHDGKICLERSVRSEVPDVLLCLAGFAQPIHQVGFEAGALTQPITYGLVEAGCDVVCMEARQIAAALSATLGALLIMVFGAPTVFVDSMGGTMGDFVLMQILGVTVLAITANLAGRLASRCGAATLIRRGTY
ncbi:MAG: hypothetical protein U0987_20585 [Afipia sp.]|nr:hypothetical protein [Afipia sp.]